MANARKCNKCGKCFDPLDPTIGTMVRFKNPVFQDADDIAANKIGCFLIPNQPDVYVDLCPDCADNFESFMHNKDGDLKGKLGAANLQILKLKSELDQMRRERDEAHEDICSLENENEHLQDLAYGNIQQVKHAMLDMIKDEPADEFKQMVIKFTAKMLGVKYEEKESVQNG